MADLPRYPGMPGWVKVFGIVAIVVFLLVAILKLTGIGGHHGPGWHFKHSGVAEEQKAPDGGHAQPGAGH